MEEENAVVINSDKLVNKSKCAFGGTMVKINQLTQSPSLEDLADLSGAMGPKLRDPEEKEFPIYGKEENVELRGARKNESHPIFAFSAGQTTLRKEGRNENTGPGLYERMLERQLWSNKRDQSNFLREYGHMDQGEQRKSMMTPDLNNPSRESKSTDISSLKILPPSIASRKLNST